MIDGNTRLTGIIGYPIEHTLSPAMQNAAFAEAGLNWIYVPFSVDPDHLAAAVNGAKALNFAGLNVTMPHKKEVIKYLDELSAPARIAGAVNTIQFDGDRLVGHNTDGQGFIDSLKHDAGFSPREKNALLIGAGGAARSVAVSLAMSGIRQLAVINRTADKALKLQESIKDNFPDCIVKVLSPDDEKIVSLQSESQLIVNTTSIGMLTNPGLPLGMERIGPSHLVYDVIYFPAETEFLREAKKRGAETLNGARMLLYQGATAWQIWTGRPAPIAEMAVALTDELELKGKVDGQSKPAARTNPDRI